MVCAVTKQFAFCTTCRGFDPRMENFLWLTDSCFGSEYNYVLVRFEFVNAPAIQDKTIVWGTMKNKPVRPVHVHNQYFVKEKVCT